MEERIKILENEQIEMVKLIKILNKEIVLLKEKICSKCGQEIN